MSQIEIEPVVMIKVNQQLKEPPMFKVIYINDNTTSMEFVVDTLVQFFDYTPQTATKIMDDIHEAGAATVAVLPYELAEQKGIEVTLSARQNDFPLQVKLEPEAS